MLLMMVKKVRFCLMMVTLVALSACSQPPKSAEYFKLHPEEIKAVAVRCVMDAKNNKDITKDKTCMTIVAVESEMCMRQMQRTGNMFGMDCSNGPAMMSLAYHGFE